MRRILIAAVAASMALGNLAFTSAEVDDAIIVDITGDANGLNGQGSVGGMGDNAGGPQATWADLTHLRVVPGAANTEIRLGVLNLAPPTDVIFRMMTEIDGCSVWFQVTNYAALEGSIRLTAACGDAAVGTYKPGVVVELDEDTSEYVMILTFKSLDPSLKKIVKAGAEASTIELSSRTFLGADGVGATVPQIDDAVDDDATFKL